ncbi:MAG: peptidylprolyl isomerase [Pseudomonadota bacterium]
MPADINFRRVVAASLSTTALFVVASFALITSALAVDVPADVEALDAENVMVIEVDGGAIFIELLPDVAPDHVARMKQLAGEGFYDGVVFHRVIDGFMAQTGDPTGTGRGGSSYPDLQAEFSDIDYERGIVGMARTNDPNSANSQFFIMFAPAPSLTGAYTVFGRVVAGMENVDAIKKGSPARNGMVDDPDAIVRARILADLSS